MAFALPRLATSLFAVVKFGRMLFDYMTFAQMTFVHMSFSQMSLLNDNCENDAWIKLVRMTIVPISFVQIAYV
jgi:hypothetical protein